MTTAAGQAGHSSQIFSRRALDRLTGYFAKPVKWELQGLATERSRALRRKVTVQELMGEALNELFKKYGKAEIAPQATINSGY